MNPTGFPVTDQTGPHDRLEEWVKRHQQYRSKRPVARHTEAAFERAHRWRADKGFNCPIILDACCGRGDSSLWAAKTYPDALVIGVDKSISRLTRLDTPHERVLRVQADLRDFYQMAIAANWRLFRHHVFYPNPYPKASQLGKRWHAMSVFPLMLQLGGVLAMRTNFPLYAEEWQIALKLSGHESRIFPVHPDKPVSLFEQKYNERGHPLTEVTCILNR